MPEDLILGLGSNIGDREDHLKKVIELLRNRVGEVIAISPIYETEPWGFSSKDKFLNLVVMMRSNLQPVELLKTILQTEAELGRTRESMHYSSRTIDIDILLYGRRIINKSGLIIPHPLIQKRRFVLVPLCDLIPEGVHPVLNKRFSRLLEECPDRGEVKLYSLPSR